MKPMEQMSRRQRAATPFALACYLVSRVRLHNPGSRVAVLWVARGTEYHKLWPDCECWDRHRDARYFRCNMPVICHPPCGPWGKYKANCFHSKADGILAMDYVHRCGGVVEQPVGSSLFAEHGRPGAVIEKINQGDWGFGSPKPTLLYWW